MDSQMPLRVEFECLISNIFRYSILLSSRYLLLLRKHLPDLVASLIVELDITVFPQTALLQELALFSQDVFDCDTLVGEYLEVIADEMAILAAGASDESGAEVVCLFRDAV